MSCYSRKFQKETAKKTDPKWSKETLTTESSGTPKPSSPSSSSQAPKASSSSSLFKGLPPTTGLRFFPDRPVSLLPFRMGVSSACPSRSRLRTMASSWKTGRRVWVLAASKLDLYILDWFLGRSCRSKLNVRSIQPKPLELLNLFVLKIHCMLFHSFQLSKSLHGFTTQIQALTLWLSHVPEVSFWTWESLRFAFTWTTKQRQTGTGCKVEVASDQPRDKPQY